MIRHEERSVPIKYEQVEAAYRKVRQGGKAAGIDNESWTDFDKKLDGNLYVIWNRLSSGSYHPVAVREVEIPKKDGRRRKLGIPTLRDRIAQQVVKEYMEERLEKLFHENSYGYRPMKSAHQALEQAKKNCLNHDWVVDMDIKNFFDEIDHELMLKAVSHVMEEKWVRMYVERWLKMPVQKTDGTIVERGGKGTPQGGVISPLLANLYLHFVLDKWLSKHYPGISFERYADDVIIHAGSKAEAGMVLEAVKRRLTEVKLQVRDEKTRVVYCKDYRRKMQHETVRFDFLGFSYQPRTRKSKFDGKLYTAFAAEISQDNQKRLREEINRDGVWKDTRLDISDIAERLNPKLRGWIGYYGLYSKSKLRHVLLQVDRRLIRWYRRKHKIGLRKAIAMYNRIKEGHPTLFYHWEYGIRYCSFE